MRECGNDRRDYDCGNFCVNMRILGQKGCGFVAVWGENYTQSDGGLGNRNVGIKESED